MVCVTLLLCGYVTSVNQALLYFPEYIVIPWPIKQFLTVLVLDSENPIRGLIRSLFETHFKIKISDKIRRFDLAEIIFK